MCVCEEERPLGSADDDGGKTRITYMYTTDREEKREFICNGKENM